ncbi:ADP-ribosylglycohydrolase family protein [Bdellovibrio sp. 22V]|uniref:ADP-ribosylglycohydrolase family protein n=1 Tax=Bdellovibrio sp. 22V TaxID=3044166 RepID=UPI002543746E|nr:ADP-ribosylglycohydrolase family protein [Bdellovibrio sp. 22V]WII72160.1 ADP-ribosylglycohydrolase family protein [Bdellovibrio sp. 22V]
MSGANEVSKERALGMLLGLHCGDSLGSTKEHQERDCNFAHKEIIGGGSSIPWRIGQPTDDTELALIILKSLQSPTFLDLATARGLMIDWYLSDPFDIGDTVRAAIKRMLDGDEFGGLSSSDSQGNGSLIRVAPLALMRTTHKELIETCFKQNLLTHGDEITKQVDVALVETLNLAMSKDCSHQELLRTLMISLHRGGINTKKIYEDAIGSWKDLPNTGWVIHTITVLAWCIVNCKTFEEALIKAVNLGGDADSNGAVVGAVFGARYGLRSIPYRWLGPLELKDVITLEINRLFES